MTKKKAPAEKKAPALTPAAIVEVLEGKPMKATTLRDLSESLRHPYGPIYFMAHEMVDSGILCRWYHNSNVWFGINAH